MEENIQNTPYNKVEPQIEPTTQYVESNHGNHNLRTMSIVTIGLIVLISAVVWMSYRADKEASLTPEQTIQGLRESSDPDYSTPAEKIQELRDLKSTSSPSTLSEEEKLERLRQRSN